ncbi:MAG TPA: M28 family peptidase [Chloroflexota bacterium]|nr:M28 family peptidase [Chloroflexota bacterium]
MKLTPGKLHTGFILSALVLVTAATAPINAQNRAPVAIPPVHQLAASADTRTLGERALDVDRTLAVDIGSRPAGSEAEHRAAAFLAQQFIEMGYATDVVPFDYTTSGGGSGTSQNVVAHSWSEDTGAPLVVVGAHYDSVPAGPGANDNGSGTSTMVEVARALSGDPPGSVAVRFVAFGAEEIGLKGSAAYVRSLSIRDRHRIALAISLDMLAVGDEAQFAGSDPWRDAAIAMAVDRGYDARDATDELRGLSDHQSFLDADIPAVLFHAESDPAYHTARDVIERVQPDYMGLMGDIAIALIRSAAG